MPVSEVARLPVVGLVTSTPFGIQRHQDLSLQSFPVEVAVKATFGIEAPTFYVRHRAIEVVSMDNDAIVEVSCHLGGQ